MPRKKNYLNKKDKPAEASEIFIMWSGTTLWPKRVTLKSCSPLTNK